MNLQTLSITAFLTASVSAQPTDLTQCGSESVKQADYRGTVSKTVSALECQRWDSQSPHRHNRTPQKYSSSGLDENYCRNPDGEDFAWCYTNNPDKRWEYCDIPKCADPDDPPTSTECGTQWAEDGSWVGQKDYRGSIAKTESGRACQRWDSQSPHQHSRTFQNFPHSGLNENYCRNPDSEAQAWCYTTDEKKRWEFCDVPVCDAGPPTAPSMCYDYTDEFTLGPKACTDSNLYRKLKKVYIQRSKEPNAPKCEGGFPRDIMALTRTTTISAAHKVLQELCDNALSEAADEAGNNGWDRLKNDGMIDLEEYFEGSGFLNEETGNFQQETDDFIKRGGYEKFIYIGDDPRLNDYLSTTEDSYNGGKTIDSFYYNEASYSVLSSPSASFQEGSCPLTNSAVCCWHRDRQYFDENGNCNQNDCANQNPMDNTDLCWTEEQGGNIFPYPGDDTEKDLHCHGFAWSKDGNDFSARAKWNNLFYVSLYDHLYQRGYAESITDDPLIDGDHQAMCGCVEDMNPVARADCTAVIARTNYTVYQDGTGGPLKILPVAETFSLEFASCRGYDYVEDFGPDDYAANPNAAELVNSNNDLSAYAFRLYLEGKISKEHTNVLEETLIGYRNPDVNDSDAQREAACKEAFETKFPGEPYTEK